MSSRPFDGLTIQSDGYTHFAAFLLVIDFMIVQTHFWSMLKHDPSVAENTAVKVLSGFAIASEFLLLTPLFLMSKIDASSAFVILLVVIGFSLVQLFCFAISLIKTWMIHGKMHSEGRIQSYDTYLKVATALIVIGSLASFLGALAGLIKFIGFCIYLHVLNCLRQSNGPLVIKRMFWAQIASICLAFITACVLVGMIVSLGMQFQDATPTSGNSTHAPINEDDVMAIWHAARGYFVGVVLLAVVNQFLALLTTGHFIGDACRASANYQPFQNSVEHGVDSDFETGNNSL